MVFLNYSEFFGEVVLFFIKVRKEIKFCWELYNVGVFGFGFRKRVKVEEGMSVGNFSY